MVLPICPQKAHDGMVLEESVSNDLKLWRTKARLNLLVVEERDAI